ASGSNGCASSHNGSGHHFSTSLISDQHYRLPVNNPKRDAVLTTRRAVGFPTGGFDTHVLQRE
ncbi:MAG: hypothetical protein M3548_03205, partial [Actinomycetota bacterium]|nr:hypothetical protein [Actinomycetota bacterium]